MSAFLLRLLRVPPQPDAPDGSPDSIRIFRAGRNYYRWRIAMWASTAFGLLLMVLLACLPLLLPNAKMNPTVRGIWQVGAFLLFALWAGWAAASFLLQRLNYELRWYIVTDRSLRIRSGIWTVEELTMTFANIQDIRIESGPLQLALGLADLVVKSAGGGSASPHAPGTSHAARFSGVDNAEVLRDLIVERLRQYRDAGLGDPDHPPASTPEATVDQAAAELLAEARALRASFR